MTAPRADVALWNYLDDTRCVAATLPTSHRLAVAEENL
jgi:hypothetical protein